ncbi:cytochrome P450 [Clostridium oryzae]|uniref:Fatty-acid peroxygenase n=1 Tax=Clostridium oryzae TaxID=1450648 RepID=A0A1V4IWH8_9CLOT|nr:cytochrome P450 [Clostridium oryzae]OPJ64145.1 fatty-acid peroxygenase [Clostridium oryzae]
MLTKERITMDESLDSTLSLSREGYLFIKNKADNLQTSLFQTHLLGQNIICMTGEGAAKIFYDPELFERTGAAPKRVQKTLFGENAIQTMDGQAHIHRKNLFISLTSSQHQEILSELVKEGLENSISRWAQSKEVVLFDEAKILLCQAACHWAGVPLNESEIEDRAEDFSQMVDGFGAVGLRYWKGEIARNITEKWIRGIIEDVRSGRLTAKEDSPLYAIAFYRELDGSELDDQMAAVELINLLRPIVAISTYITFAALALCDHIECKQKILTDNSNYLEMFVQEVRRYYPFTPFVGAKVKKDFVINGCQFKKDTLVLLDVYGTNHDSRIWKEPNKFYPERFKEWNESPFNFIPQGGGDAATSHRCPGEEITTEIMKTCVDFLVNSIEFKVPPQNLRYNLARIPSLPKSGFVMSNVRRKNIL